MKIVNEGPFLDSTPEIIGETDYSDRLIIYAGGEPKLFIMSTWPSGEDGLYEEPNVRVYEILSHEDTSISYPVGCLVSELNGVGIVTRVMRRLDGCSSGYILYEINRFGTGSARVGSDSLMPLTPQQAQYFSQKQAQPLDKSK